MPWDTLCAIEAHFCVDRCNMRSSLAFTCCPIPATRDLFMSLSNFSCDVLAQRTLGNVRIKSAPLTPGATAGISCTMDAQDSGYVSAEDEDFVLDAATAAKDDALEAQASGALHEPEEPQDSTLTWHQRRKKARRKYEKAAREMANKVEAALQDVAPLWDKLQDGGPTPPLGQDWSSMRSQGHVASTTRGRKRQRSDVDDVLKQRLALSKQPDSRAVQVRRAEIGSLAFALHSHSCPGAHSVRVTSRSNFPASGWLCLGAGSAPQRHLCWRPGLRWEKPKPTSKWRFSRR